MHHEQKGTPTTGQHENYRLGNSGYLMYSVWVFPLSNFFPMTEETLYITIAVKVKSKLSLEETIDELGSECAYEIPSTDNVTVVSTEWLDTSTQQP